MDLLNPTMAKGSQVDIFRTDPRHFDVNGQTGPLGNRKGKATFQDAMMSAMEGVNADQMKASDLYQQMITNPDSIDAHDVTIAAAQAQMSLNLAKNIVERGLQAYRDILNMR